MKLNLFAGLVAGFIALTPAVAHAGPASVTVRVEGAARTLVESSPVTTSAAAVVKDGHDCPGTSAGGALDKATAGNWQASYSSDFNDFFITQIAGETPPGTGYWSLWVNHKYAQAGACSSELQAGDDVLFLSDRCDVFVPPSTCSDQVFPLGLTAPATVLQGSSAQVTVVRYDADGKTAPVEGATVGGATTDAAGHATVSFPQAGSTTLKADKPGFARSEARGVAVTVPGAAPQVPTVVATTPDRTPPTAKLQGFADHQVFTSGPRELKGSFGADPSGLQTVKLRLTKRVAGRCWYFSGSKETFRRTRCGGGKYFAIGDRADWSYLLPERLAKGRYVLDAIAIDKAGNRTPLARGTTRVVFTVR